MTEVVNVIQDSPDLHKLFVRFSQPKSFNIFRIFDEYERLYAFGSHAIYNIRVRVWLYRIYNLSPSVRACISDTTLPLMLYIVLVNH